MYYLTGFKDFASAFSILHQFSSQCSFQLPPPYTIIYHDACLWLSDFLHVLIFLTLSFVSMYRHRSWSWYMFRIVDHHTCIDIPHTHSLCKHVPSSIPIHAYHNWSLLMYCLSSDFSLISMYHHRSWCMHDDRNHKHASWFMTVHAYILEDGRDIDACMMIDNCKHVSWCTMVNAYIWRCHG